MKAQIIDQFGDPSVFNLKDIAVPEIKPGHVLIKVVATSVNPIDCKIRSGAVPTLAPAFPAVLHGDVAGIVASVGENVTAFKKGDEIYGFAGGFCGLGGALAEYMLADTDLIAKKPAKLSMQEAAALPLVGLTAWIALFEKAGITQGMPVLIHGGAGGVGHIAIQLAKSNQSKVYTTVRKNDHVSTLKSLGADEVINNQEENVEAYTKRLTQGKGFQTIIDTVGSACLDDALAAAAPNGTVITLAARSTHDLTPLHRKGLGLHGVFMLAPLLTGQGRQHCGHILKKIAQLADQGNLSVRVDPQKFELNGIAHAHALLESGRSQGKVVVSVEN